jgi:cell division protein FtsZ
MPGLINVDFADVKAIMSNAGSALMGIGQAGGENRAATAARMAIASPLLEVSIEGAKGVLFNIVGGPDLGMNEVNEAALIIAQAAEPDANIIFGATIKEDLVDMVKISVIATGFDESRERLREYAGIGRMGQSAGSFNSQQQNPFIGTTPSQPSSSYSGSQPTQTVSQMGSQSPFNGSGSQQTTPQSDTDEDDEFGQSAQEEQDSEDDLEIPAFLRQTRS